MHQTIYRFQLNQEHPYELNGVQASTDWWTALSIYSIKRWAKVTGVRLQLQSPVDLEDNQLILLV